jgi:hypothetical protein
MSGRRPTKRMLHAAALLIALAAGGCPAFGDDFMRGADISFLPQVETGGGVFRDVPDGRGRGVCWWAPEWIAAPGFGSAWENLALFDETGEALPALDAFAPLASADEAPIRTGLRPTPDPFSGQTTVFPGSTAGAPHRLEVFGARESDDSFGL